MEILKPFKIATQYFEGHRMLFTEITPTCYALRDDLKDRLNRYRNLAFPSFTGPEIPIHANSPPTPDTIFANPRPQRSARLPQHLDDYEVGDLPGQRNRIARAATPNPHGGEEQEQEDEAVHDDGNDVLVKSIALGLEKLNKYIEVLTQSLAYWYALILHLGHRSKWLDRNLPPCKAVIIDGLRRLYEDEYAYREESILAMSGEVERAFSSTKLILGIHWVAMGDNTISMLLCLKNWGRN